MKKIPHLALALAAGLAAAPAAWADPIPVSLIVLMPGDKAQIDAFTDKLRTVPYLANSKDSVEGSNVALLVSVSQVPTTGGAAASVTTGLLAATTLGLLPTVENKDISVHYELRANHEVIAVFDYHQNFTSVSNIYGKFGKLPDDARAWVTQTVDSLALDLQASAPATALQAEYATYLSAAK